MSRTRYLKGNLHKDDIFRVLVTDTLPAEVPIIFSNDGFYENKVNEENWTSDTKKLLDCLLLAHPKKQEYTIPYRYRIFKDSISTRRLSLIHPKSQLAVANFYMQYEDLICTYSGVSEFSIRAPKKVGSTYFFRSTIADKNKYKGQSIDTLQFENRIRNPASFFSYEGFDRLYKFFDSTKFTLLEKKFKVMWFGDVSKCFDSIYTHSVTWAVKDMPFAKEAIGKQSFGNAFDVLMQKMNYNETNGICIGPEVSRIFAEMILQKVDQIALKKLIGEGLKRHTDFDCVRYVDDFIIFARDEEIAAAVYAEIDTALLEFNLHFNSSKLLQFERPFYTPKSWIVHKLNKSMDDLQNKLFEYEYTSIAKHPAPLHVYRPPALKKAFIKDVKSTCLEVGVGYDMVANYLVSSLSNKIEGLLDGYSEFEQEERRDLERYLTTNMILLDLMFYFYTMHPTVAPSFKLSKAIVLTIQFISKHMPDRKPYLSEQLSTWTMELVKSLNKSSQNLRKEQIPIEVINIVLALSEIDNTESFSVDFLSRTIFDEEKTEYFSTISLLFFIKDNPEYSSIKSKLADLLLKKFSKQIDLRKDAHDIHLFLDVIACPYIPKDTRATIVQQALSSLEVKVVSKKRALAIVDNIEQKPWFTNWSGVDLLNMIKRKELSQVY